MSYHEEQLPNWNRAVVDFFVGALVAEYFTHLLPGELQAIPRRPESFSRESMASIIDKALATGRSPDEYLQQKITDADRQLVLTIADHLSSQGVSVLIDQGKLTVGMVRPQANYNRWGLSDAMATRAIVAKALVEPRLIPAFRISIPFTDEAVKLFYDTSDNSPKTRQISIPPIVFPDRFANRWEEFKDLMKSGPVTLFLLYDEEGKAISKWRAKVGQLKEPEPLTIRGSLMKTDMHNNLVHGSDSIEAVHRELDIWVQLLRSIGQPQAFNSTR